MQAMTPSIAVPFSTGLLDDRPVAISQNPKTTVERPVILGLPFDHLTQADALDAAVETMRSDGAAYWVTANLDFVAQAHEDPAFHQIVEGADRNLADGKPILWMSRLLGKALPECVTGSDLTPALLARCAEEGLRVFFLGSDEETLGALTRQLSEALPSLNVAGSIAPPHGSIDDWDNASFVQKIREARPHLLLVALGCPKQEEWMVRFRAACRVPLSIGIGASLDFMTGRQVRAPRWMRQVGLEWLWRLSTAPRRLFRRYVRDFGVLLRLGLRDWASTLRRTAPASVKTLAETEAYRLLRVQGSLAQGLAGELRADQTDRHLILDLGTVRQLNPKGVDHLIALSHRLSAAGKRLLLLKAPDRLRRRLEARGLSDTIVCRPTLLHALEVLAIDPAPTEPLEPILIRATAPLTAERLEWIEERALEMLNGDHLPFCLNLHVETIEAMSRHGIGRLLLLRNALLEAGCDLLLCGLTDRLADLLEMTGAAGLIPNDFLTNPSNRTSGQPHEILIPA